MNVTLEVVGIAGGLLVLFAFLQVSMNKWNGKSFWYETFNVVGCICLLYYAWQKQAYTNIVINLVWAAVALYALKHIIERHYVRKQKRRTKPADRRKRTA